MMIHKNKFVSFLSHDYPYQIKPQKTLVNYYSTSICPIIFPIIPWFFPMILRHREWQDQLLLRDAYGLKKGVDFMVISWDFMDIYGELTRRWFKKKWLELMVILAFHQQKWWLNGLWMDSEWNDAMAGKCPCSELRSLHENPVWI